MAVEVGQGHFGLSVPVCSVPVPGTAIGPAALSVPPAVAAAGLADLLLRLPELADWLGRLRGQRERRGLRWTAAQLQPGAAPEPAAATTAAGLATELSAGKEEKRRDEGKKLRTAQKRGKRTEGDEEGKRECSKSSTREASRVKAKQGPSVCVSCKSVSPLLVGSRSA